MARTGGSMTPDEFEQGRIVKHCAECEAPYELLRKFNGGNPMTVELPTCHCEEERFFEKIKRRFPLPDKPDPQSDD